MIVDLHLRGEKVVVVGGGLEGQKKVEALLTQDCEILVLSDKVNSTVQKYQKEGKIEYVKERLQDTKFLEKYHPYIVMATTDDKELNRKIVEKAKELNCIAYASDDPTISDFSHPSIINIQDTIQVAVSTGGRSPAMARKLKLQAEKIFKEVVDAEDIFQIKLQEFARNAAKGRLSDQKERKKYLYSLMSDNQIKQLIKDKKFKDAENRALRLLGDWK